MTENYRPASQNRQDEEKILTAPAGLPILLLNIILMLAAVFALVRGIQMNSGEGAGTLGVVLIVIGFLYLLVIGPVIFTGLKVLGPNEALVFTIFGKYYGTLKKEGFYFVNPFAVAVKPVIFAPTTARVSGPTGQPVPMPLTKRISLKVTTLSNDKQKINDLLGTPIIISIVVVWRVVNTAKAVFNVDNYVDFLSIQCDAALREIVRSYPYDTPGSDDEMSLRGSSQGIAEELRKEIQAKVDIAGLEILEARITHLAYAPEIAAAMLQRQQAAAIIDARQMIVEGAVGMVETALAKLNEYEIVELDEERKAAMVNNLLVVLCGSRDPQPVINSGSLY
jgi:regulator of protease activity HflC (stomatin/prohibitin superfamily)